MWKGVPHSPEIRITRGCATGIEKSGNPFVELDRGHGVVEAGNPVLGWHEGSDVPLWERQRQGAGMISFEGWRVGRQLRGLALIITSFCWSVGVGG